MPAIRGVIFDFGSTLIRFRGDWDDVLSRGRLAMATWLKQAGYPLDVQAFSQAVQRAFQVNFRDRHYDHRERASRQILREALAEIGLPAVPEDDLREALRRLYAPSEACWSPVPGVHEAMSALFEGILRQWWIEPQEAVMVGDLLGEDILGAQRAGLHQIWVRADADPAFNAEFQGKVIPEWTVDTVQDVPALLLPLAADSAE